MNALKLFGYSSFNYGQKESVESVMSGSDTFVSMSTGSGKSLCYQLPVLEHRLTRPPTRPMIALVISPLISLMQDQVRNINSKIGVDTEGIPVAADAGIRKCACFLGSSQPDYEVERDAVSGLYPLVYLSPEKLSSMTTFKNVMYIAIDEAHCLIDYSFRPEYAKLGLLKKDYAIDHPKGVPLIILTATATPSVQRDILKILLPADDPTDGHRSVKVIRSTFNRPNLSYNVRAKKSLSDDIAYIIKIFNQMSVGPERTVGTDKVAGGTTGGSMIIYTLTRKETEKIAGLLSSIGARGYHAGLSLDTRTRVQTDFKDGSLRVIVATIAFGLGIDKPNIRYVIHYGIPKSLEAYYQETGRAGRDSKKSICIMFWSPVDISKNNYFIESDKEINKSVKIIDYVVSNRCRREMILEYFNEPGHGPCSGPDKKCDHCRAEVSTVTEAPVGDPDPQGAPGVTETEETREPCGASVASEEADISLLIRAILETGSRYGMQVPIDYLRGSLAKKNNSLKRLSTYGLGSGKSVDYWKRLHLVAQSKDLVVLEKINKMVSVYKVSAKGQSFITG
jgi:ATP-dependent DNA helicase RecQ